MPITLKLLEYLKRMKPFLIAAFPTILMQPVIFCIWYLGPSLILGKTGFSSVVKMFSSDLVIYILVVAAILLLIIGLPIFLILIKINKLNVKNIMLTGFLIGALPIIFLSYPLDNSGNGFSYGGNWHGTYVEGMNDGVHTKYAWYIYIEKIIGFGVHGLLAALVFFCVWSKFEEESV